MIIFHGRFHVCIARQFPFEITIALLLIEFEKIVLNAADGKGLCILFPDSLVAVTCFVIHIITASEPFLRYHNNYSCIDKLNLFCDSSNFEQWYLIGVICAKELRYITYHQFCMENQKWSKSQKKLNLEQKLHVLDLLSKSSRSHYLVTLGTFYIMRCISGKYFPLLFIMLLNAISFLPFAH